MYRTKILGNQRDFLNSLYQMIKLNDISFSKCDGLTSDFSLVPESVLEECFQHPLRRNLPLSALLRQQLQKVH